MNLSMLPNATDKEERLFPVLVKADVQGSAEALSRALQELNIENDAAVVKLDLLTSEAGEVNKNDITMAASAPGTSVIAFNCGAAQDAVKEAHSRNVPILYFDIVYEAIEDVREKMLKVLSPTPEGAYVGAATVQEVFYIDGTGNIAGCKCTDGTIQRGANVRIMRGDKILRMTAVKSLRHFREQVETVYAGTECGISLASFEDFEVGDIIECYIK